MDVYLNVATRRNRAPMPGFNKNTAFEIGGNRRSRHLIMPSNVANNRLVVELSFAPSRLGH
ncbi:MAG: hypothetical protein [Olavius algarvensis Gamma 1 endosymbiont]|nr:MAG: hypothetical protein [Olavius algarvensis Gamma 1 endosymbiont]